MNVERVSSNGFSGKQVVLFILAAIFVTALITYFVIRYYIFPNEFKPVILNASEQQRLEQKLSEFDRIKLKNNEKDDEIAGNIIVDGQTRLEPQAYNEDGASRMIEFNEKELNSILASNTDMAKRLAIDLSDDLASVKLLVPIDPDFPFMGGKTLRINAGAQMSFENDRPVVILKGISIMGVPIPNAWLGNLKNVDLIGEFGEAGFWKAFANGVQLIEVKENKLRIMLKE